jgi:outer membrane protein assembly factor BamA
MSAIKVKVAVAVLLTVSALGIGLGVSQYASPGGGRAGADQVAAADAPGRECMDICVQVQEQRTGSLLFGIGVNSNAGLTGSIVLNERNFDILRPPTRYDEVLNGSAFRGAGQEFRIEAAPGPVEGVKVGGDFLFLNSIEYQMPVRANDGIFQDAFIDGGRVGQKVEIKDYRVSAGFGLRFAIPMLGPAPIALDFGFPLMKQSEAPRRLFSFWMGYFS